MIDTYFEGGWSVGSFRRKDKRGEREPGQSLFFYKDKGSALLGHKLMLAECGPSRTWVIIQEVTTYCVHRGVYPLYVVPGTLKLNGYTPLVSRHVIS